MKVTSGDVVRALEVRYNPPSKPRQFATFTEVMDQAQRRRVDFLAVGLWQSKGRMIEGVEVKVARQDWKRELEHPKADPWFAVCDRWWLAAPVGIVLPGELPKPWGHLELRPANGGFRLYKVVQAPDLTPPEEWPGWLVMRLLTRIDQARKATPAELLAAEQHAREQYSTGYARGQEHSSGYSAANVAEAAEYKALVEALGDDDFQWRNNPRRVAEVRRARELLDSGQLDMAARRTVRLFREVATSIEAALPDEPAN